jgi:hypothetical protein
MTDTITISKDEYEANKTCSLKLTCPSCGNSIEVTDVNYTTREDSSLMIEDQRQILSWCASLEEAKINGEFEHNPEDSYFLKQVKTVFQLATMDIKKCWCEKCDIDLNGMRTRMSICPDCGDKRCPKAKSHNNCCQLATMDIKYCKDCKYMAPFERCVAPQAFDKIDLVNGGRTRTYECCSVLRQNHEGCKEAGLWFVKKEEEKQEEKPVENMSASQRLKLFVIRYIHLGL